MKKISVITLFPEIIQPALNSSMLFKAKKIGAVQFELINLRDFGLGRRKTVDDTPYGGGDGMLLRIEPLVAALEFAKKNNLPSKTILLSPSQIVWNQKMAQNFAKITENLILICGHYEGFDARIENFIDQKISVGPYILTGGEIPALAIVDSVTRLLPGVLGGENSAAIESYSDGENLEFPQFTRPEKFREFSVPEILLSGNHGKIAKWRESEARKLSEK